MRDRLIAIIGLTFGLFAAFQNCSSGTLPDTTTATSSAAAVNVSVTVPTPAPSPAPAPTPAPPICSMQDVAVG